MINNQVTYAEQLVGAVGVDNERVIGRGDVRRSCLVGSGFAVRDRPRAFASKSEWELRLIVLEDGDLALFHSTIEARGGLITKMLACTNTSEDHVYTIVRRTLIEIPGTDSVRLHP
jgi:hypothetical protein